jgi:2'-5' RNA ligase
VSERRARGELRARGEVGAPGELGAHGERARLFVALELPAEVRATLLQWRGGVPGAGRLRLIPAECLHVTLCFLGWREVGEIPAIAAACALSPRPPAATLTLGEAIWLPPRRPRVLAVKVGDPDGALTRVQAAVSAALAAGGWYAPEGRAYLPHVTVARVRAGAARVPAGERVRAEAVAPPAPLEFVGSEVTLYRSHLGGDGARYEALARVGLGA